MRYIPFTSLAVLLGVALAGPPALAGSAAAAKSDIVALQYERFQLDNGLTVVVHEDHKAPVVSVGVWYHIGSADEPVGKTGFAHLYEHLMFSCSENHKDGFFKPFELVGATSMNGSTFFDRTNYYETVPSTAVDMALWLESDRMGHLLGAIGQKELDAQRGVVENEKREGENGPYGMVPEIMSAAIFPANHPYHHDTIGSVQDLDAASLADVKQWFNDHYGAANTTLVLAGDITVAAARAKALRYFGDIPAGPPVARQQPWIAARQTSTRAETFDQVAQVQINREWNVPPLSDGEYPLLDLAADLLGYGKTSRLYERLVYKDQIADDASARIMNLSLASMFSVTVQVKKDVDPAKVEAAIADEWAHFLKDGPTQGELDRVRTQRHAFMARSLERVTNQGQDLAEGQLYRNDPTAYVKDFAIMDAATPATVAAAARKWLAKGDYTLVVKPGTRDPVKDAALLVGLPAATGKPQPVMPSAREFRTVKSNVDRSKGVPIVTSFPDLSIPRLQRAKLKNGIEVVFAERHSAPFVRVEVLFDSGYAADQGRKLGTASFATRMMSEGTQTLDALEITRRKDALGAEFRTKCDLDTCRMMLISLKSKFDPALALWSDVLRNPGFRDADIQRVRGLALGGIAQEKTSPVALAVRTLPPLIYGKGHAYAVPLTGSGTEASIGSLTTQDLRAFVGDYVRPDNARIIVVGDTTLQEVVGKLNAALGDWISPSHAVPKKNLWTVAVQTAPRVYVMDRPGADQSVIIAGVVAASSLAPNYLEVATMNTVFGGIFSSRLNMNLREDKHWAYGAGSFMEKALGQSPFVMYAPVQSDKTAESMREMLSEARGVIGGRPITDEEVVKVKQHSMRTLPSDYETIGGVGDALDEIVTYHRPDNYIQTLKQRIDGQKDADVEAAARQIIEPDGLTWVVVGDRKRIEQPIRDLKIGEIHFLDADGNVVK